MKKIWKVWTVILVVAATVLLTISTQYSKKEEISTDSYQYLIGVSLMKLNKIGMVRNNCEDRT